VIDQSARRHSQIRLLGVTLGEASGRYARTAGKRAADDVGVGRKGVSP